MENNERDRKLEQWLDEALSEYSAAEPRLGLVQRVLNRVHGEEKTRARRWNLWKWMPALAAIAAAVIVGVAFRPMMMRKSEALQMSSRLEQQVSSLRSGQKAGATAANSIVIAPAKKAIAKNEVDARLRDKSESRTQTSTVRADSAKVGLKDTGRASNAFSTDGAAVTSTNGNLATGGLVAAPPSPQVPISGRNYQSLIVNRPSSAAGASGASTATNTVFEVTPVGGPVPMDESAGARLNQQQIPLQTMQMAPVKPASTDAKAAAESAPSGIIAVESVSVTKETAALKKVKAKKREQEQAAKARAEDANVVDVFGMRLRTDIKQAPAGPMQFPTPAPLSEQEKLVLAAAKKMKNAPVKQDAQGGVIPDVEIKEIEIKPLEGPKK